MTDPLRAELQAPAAGREREACSLIKLVAPRASIKRMSNA